MRGIRRAVLGCLALGLAACATPPSGEPAGPQTPQILSDQTVGQIRKGNSRKEDVRALLGAPAVINQQAGNEVWIYQAGNATTQRTLTVQYDPLGVVTQVNPYDRAR